MVRALNAYGNIAPIKSPENSNGDKILTTVMLDRVMNAPNRARLTKAADPIANPLPIAAVVFPAASRASVF